MKQLIKIGFLFTFIMGLALAVFIIFNNENKSAGRDIVEYNDKLHLVQQDLEKGESEEKVEKKYKCHIILSTKIEDEELSKMYVNNALVLDLHVNGEYVGKVAWDDNKEDLDRAKRAYFGGGIYLWVIMLICGYIMLFLFYRSFIKHVGELTKFSEEIAKGNLDVELPIHKNNFFGNFVEAFDQMREELKDSRLREIEAERARKEMVTDLGHDIKTPISVIKVACEVLDAKARKRLEKIESDERDVENKIENTESETETENIVKTVEDEEIKDIEYTLEKVSTINQKADLISSLMSNLMHSTLEDIDKLEVNPIETDSRIIRSFFDNLKNYGHIIIENEVPPCIIYLDSLRMEQVIDNVVGNSHKYAHTDIRVRFSESSILSADGINKENFVKITIKDSGKGVKEEDLPLITQKYYRGSNSKQSTGYGLGMYLVKRYMEMQKGGMEYYNDNGFTVELLLKKV